MADSDLTAPLLQLNPPVLVRTTGGDVGAIDLVALRRSAAAGTNAASGTPARPLRGGFTASPASSVAVRKLRDAKRTAQSVTRAQTVQAPESKRKSSLTGRSIAVLGAAASARAAGTPSGRGKGTAAAATGGGEGPPSRGGSAPATASHNIEAPEQQQRRASTVVAATAAAAAPIDGSRVAMNLPHLMRHIQDTGALLDTLFPLSLAPTGAPAGEGLTAVQTVSTAPAFRDDVIALHATLRERLEARRARPTGLCAIRRSLYRDLFSELVRQVTVEEPVRGLLLARVREEAEHALQVHAALLREGGRFAAGKLLQDTQHSTVLQERVSVLEEEKVALEARQHELLEACHEVERRFEEDRQLRRKQQQDELNYLRRANQQLSLRLKMETERETAGGDAEPSGNGGAAAAVA